MNSESPGATVRYCNTFRVGYNAAEFVLEFGHAYEGHEEVLAQRLVTSPAYAKAFGQLILQTVREYETRYGEIPAAPE